MSHNHYKDFSSNMRLLARQYEPGRVFEDFLTMAICAFHRVNIQTQLQEKDEENENLYMQVVNRYDKDSINIFPKLLAILKLKILDDPYSDLLGQYFTEHITRGQNGQFFTPEHICELMILMNGLENETGKRVLDPACGSGRMLLKSAKHSPNNYFFGADISATCAKMATINFFLNGLRGEVAWMNSLSMEWFGGWHINMNGIGILPIKKEQSLIWSAPPDHSSPKNKASQLTLF